MECRNFDPNISKGLRRCPKTIQDDSLRQGFVREQHGNREASAGRQARNFEITLISANDLEDVRKLFKMKVYVRVSLGGSTETEQRTPADKHGEINPAWNFTMKYTICESMVQHYNTVLVIKMYCKRKLGDRYVGEVHTPMKELFDYAIPLGGSAVVNYPVQKGSVNSQGVLKLSYRFGQKVAIDKLLMAETFADWSTFKCSKKKGLLLF